MQCPLVDFINESRGIIKPQDSIAFKISLEPEERSQYEKRAYILGYKSLQYIQSSMPNISYILFCDWLPFHTLRANHINFS